MAVVTKPMAGFVLPQGVYKYVCAECWENDQPSVVALLGRGVTLSLVSIGVCNICDTAFMSPSLKDRK